MKQIEMKPVGELRPSPSNPRQRYDTLPMAELVQRMCEMGFLPTHPLLVTSEGEIVQGHRRYVAWLVTKEITSADGGCQEDVDLIATKILHLQTGLTMTPGDQRDIMLVLAEELAEKHGDEAIPCMVDESDEKHRALLFFDPAGESPDLLGEAMALRRAVALGWTASELSRYVGKGQAYINARLPLADIDPMFAWAIEDGTFPLSIAGTLSALPEPKRGAMTEFLFGMVVSGRCVLPVLTINDVAKKLHDWDGFQLPLVFDRQSQRNAARAACVLWKEAVESNPHAAYVGAAKVISSTNNYKEPWRDQPAMTVWVDIFKGGKPASGHYVPIMVELLKKDGRVSCATCPLSQLPDQKLAVELARFPCRIDKAAALSVGACLMGYSPNDSIEIPVPASWPPSDLYAVSSASGDRQVVSAEDLLVAWNLASGAEAEAASAAAKAKEQKSKGKDKAKNKVKKENPTETAPAAAAEAAPAAAAEAAPAAPAEMSLLQRSRLATDAYRVFIEVQPQNHPLAASCSRCKFNQPGSGCEWALSTTGRIVRFTELATDDGLFSVPFCHQYRPENWVDIIPDWTGVIPQRLTRQAALSTIKSVVDGMRMSVLADTKPYQWLTGRPMNTSEKYDNWLGNQLDEQSGNLRDGQIAFLYMMLPSEIERAKKRPFFVPVGDGVIWHQVKEVSLKLGVEDEK